MKQIVISIIASVVVSVSVVVAMDKLTPETVGSSVETTHFKVVDVQQLSKVILGQLKTSLAEGEHQLSPELIEVMAQAEARKLFNTIAHSANNKDIILAKNSIIYVPDRYDITEDIANQLGLEGVVSTTLKEKLAQGQSVLPKEKG